MSYTVNDVTTALAKVTDTHRFGHATGEEFYPYSDDGENVEWNELHYDGRDIDTEIGQIKVVQAEGGGEGDGEDAWLVIQTVNTGQYFRVDGYYQSFDGLYLDGELREVRPVERTVVFYE